MTEKIKIAATIYWADLYEKNELADAYQVVLGNLSDAAVAKLEEVGLTVADPSGAVKEDDDGNEVPDEKKREMGRYITCKSKNFPIKAYDSDGVIIPQDTKIGNGSKAKAVVSAYPWKFKNKKGFSPTLERLIVSDLVEYVAGDVSIDDEDVL